MTEVTLLISSAGRRVGLIECFRQSARSAGIDLTVLACDVEPALSAACHAADRAFAVPRCDSATFVDALLAITTEYSVDLVVPTIDPELAPLAAAAERFASHGTRVHVSPPPVIDIVRDKLKTCQALQAADVPVPWTIALEDARDRAGTLDWPLFLKPSAGSASRGIRVVDSHAELPQAPDEPMILQQLLEGPEFTVNMFVDGAGVLKGAIAHERLRTRAGEVEKGRTKRDPVFRRLAEGIVRALPQARGVLCFQAIDDERTGPRVFEINARFGGGYPLAHHAGADYARWLIEAAAGLPSDMHDNWSADLLMLRYDAAFFPAQGANPS